MKIKCLLWAIFELVHRSSVFGLICHDSHEGIVQCDGPKELWQQSYCDIQIRTTPEGDEHVYQQCARGRGNDASFPSCSHVEDPFTKDKIKYCICNEDECNTADNCQCDQDDNGYSGSGDSEITCYDNNVLPFLPDPIEYKCGPGYKNCLILTRHVDGADPMTEYRCGDDFPMDAGQSTCQAQESVQIADAWYYCGGDKCNALDHSASCATQKTPKSPFPQFVMPNLPRQCIMAVTSKTRHISGSNYCYDTEQCMTLSVRDKANDVIESTQSCLDFRFEQHVKARNETQNETCFIIYAKDNGFGLASHVCFCDSKDSCNTKAECDCPEASVTTTPDTDIENQGNNEVMKPSVPLTMAMAAWLVSKSV